MIVIKVSLLRETHTVDVSIEDAGSMFGKGVTCFSYRIFNNTVKQCRRFV